MLPNVGSVWLNLRPAPVPVREFDRITEAIDRNEAHHAQRSGSIAAAARRLVRGVRRDTASLSRIRLRDDRKLSNRISAGDAKLGRRVDVSLMPAIRQAKADRKKQRALIRKRERRELWNQLVLVSAAPLMAAYGQRGNPFSENNLVIALSLGVWLFGDEIADMLSVKRAIKQGSIQGLDVWSYTAPFANLLTGWWLLGGRQHKRFITGMIDLKDPQYRIRLGDVRRYPYAVVAEIDLSSRIAPEHLRDFQAFKHVPAIATIQSVEFAADSEVDRPLVSLHLQRVEVITSVLLIIVGVSSIQPELKRLQIAWVVDTRKPTA